VGRRSRARAREGAPADLRAPTSDYTDGKGNTLTLRGSLTLGARREYARTLSGEAASAAATREDAEQRALELLFERLAVRWSVPGPGRTQADAAIERPKELLARLRAASPAERAWVRGTLREHCAEWFPDVQAP
jgi:ribosomal protein S11